MVRRCIENATHRQIADELGLTRAAVSQRLYVLRKKGVKIPPTRGLTHEQQQIVIQAMEELRQKLSSTVEPK